MVWGSRPGCCLQRQRCFKHLWRVFFRSHWGHEPKWGGHGSQGPLLSFFLFWAASWSQAVSENSPDMQHMSEQSTDGVVSCKTSSAVPLISRDRGRCRTGARCRSGSPGGMCILGVHDCLPVCRYAQVTLNICIDNIQGSDTTTWIFYIP